MVLSLRRLVAARLPVAVLVTAIAVFAALLVGVRPAAAQTEMPNACGTLPPIAGGGEHTLSVSSAARLGRLAAICRASSETAPRSARTCR